MISFQSDYNNGMLPEILEALSKTNNDKHLDMGLTLIPKQLKRRYAKRWTMRTLMCFSW